MIAPVHVYWAITAYGVDAQRASLMQHYKVQCHPKRNFESINAAATSLVILAATAFDASSHAYFTSLASRDSPVYLLVMANLEKTFEWRCEECRVTQFGTRDSFRIC